MDNNREQPKNREQQPQNRERQMQDPNDPSGVEKGGYSDGGGGSVNDFARIRENVGDGKTDQANTLRGEKEAMHKNIDNPAQGSPRQGNEPQGAEPEEVG